MNEYVWTYFIYNYTYTFMNIHVYLCINMYIYTHSCMKNFLPEGILRVELLIFLRRQYNYYSIIFLSNSIFKADFFLFLYK